MPVTDSKTPYLNRLLARLAPGDTALLCPHLEPWDMPVRFRLESPNRTIPHVYFVEHGFVSIVATSTKETEIEVGLIGCEGMSGAAVVLGNHRSPHATYVQMAGSAHRVLSADLRRCMAASPTLHAVLLRFVQSFLIQTAQTANANSKGKVDQRLARWLLMAHDRSDGNELVLTHEFLSVMLGVRRTGVTVALGALQRQGLIDARRRNIAILDRGGLRRLAGPFYGVPEAEAKRLLA